MKKSKKYIVSVFCVIFLSLWTYCAIEMYRYHEFVKLLGVLTTRLIEASEKSIDIDSDVCNDVNWTKWATDPNQENFQLEVIK